MANLTLRAAKGIPLTHTELDDNFSALNAESATTIAAMQAIVAPTNGQIVTVTDLTRGGLFVYNSALSGTNNGGTIIAGWVRQYSGAVNVLWFGTNTSPGTTDMTPFIQAAIDLVYTQGGGDVFIPTGRYGVTAISRGFSGSRITVNLIGAGKTATKLEKIGGTTTPIIHFYSTTAGPISTYSSIEKLSVIGLAKANIGVRFTRLAYHDLRDVEIQNCDLGFDNEGTQNFNFWNVSIGSNNTGYRCRAYPDPDPELEGKMRANEVSFFSGAIRHNTVYGCDIGESSGHHFNSVIFLYNGVEPDPANTGAIIWRSSVTNEWGASIHTVTNCWFEYPGGMFLRSEAAPNLQLAIRNCSLVNPSPTQLQGNIADFAIMKSLVLENCVANGASPPSTITSAATRTLLIGGVIWNYVDDSTTTKINTQVPASGDPQYIFRGPAVRVDEVYADERAYIKETAAVGTNYATFGQLWLKNTTPQGLWFTDQAGTDKALIVTDEVISGEKTLTAADSGKTFFLVTPTGYTITLPIHIIGLKYTFLVAAVPTGGAGYNIVTNNGDNDLYGTILDATGGTTHFVARDGIKFVEDVAVASDRIEMVCDGAWWHITARSGATGGITTSQTT